jgi:hypothetical protein
VATSNCDFHEWWQDATARTKSNWADRLCLNEAPARFHTPFLGPGVNVGFWRSDRACQYEPLRDVCTLLHVRFFRA